MGKNKDLPSATWTNELVLIFCDLCIKEIDAGHRPGTHLDKDGYKNLMKNFKKQTSIEYDRTQMKNKWDQLKKLWKLWKNLKGNEVGIGWDPKKRTIDAYEDWWKERLKVHPKAKQFRTNGIDPELEGKLDRMFTSIVVTGNDAWTPNSGILPPATLEEGRGDSEEIKSLKAMEMDIDAVVSKIDPDSEQFVGSKRSLGATATESKENKKTKISYHKDGAEMFQTQQLVDATVSVNKSTATTARKQGFNISDAIEALNYLEGIEKYSDVYGFALDLLMNKDYREAFMSFDAEGRMWFINRELKKSKTSASSSYY